MILNLVSSRNLRRHFFLSLRERSNMISISTLYFRQTNSVPGDKRYNLLAIRTNGTLADCIDRYEITLVYIKREINYAPPVAKKNDKPYRPTMRARQAEIKRYFSRRRGESYGSATSRNQFCVI